MFFPEIKEQNSEPVKDLSQLTSFCVIEKISLQSKQKCNIC